MEAIGMALLAAVAYSTVLRNADMSVSFPLLGALALGAQRLIPTFQLAYASWSTIVGSAATLADTLSLLAQPLPDGVTHPGVPDLPFEHSVAFDDVGFSYGEGLSEILAHANFAIPKGARVGIVGATGSGKSTLVDLLMGLLEPSTGGLLVDGAPIVGESKRAWQRRIAHVPQNVFLTDGTLVENITLSTPVTKSTLTASGQ
jgi:ATP-binding cassette subfamily B protein